MKILNLVEDKILLLAYSNKKCKIKINLNLKNYLNPQLLKKNHLCSQEFQIYSKYLKKPTFQIYSKYRPNNH